MRNEVYSLYGFVYFEILVFHPPNDPLFPIPNFETLVSQHSILTPSRGPTLKSISIHVGYSVCTAGVKFYTLHGTLQLWGWSPECANICTCILVSG